MGRKIEINIGDKIGEILITEIFIKNNKKYYKCKCDCGLSFEISHQELISRKRTNCGQIHNIINKKFGRLTPLEYIEHNGRKKWKCVCDCGNITYVSTSNLKRGNSTSCGCYKSESTTKRLMVDEIGNIYGYLTVLGYAYSKNNEVYWKCKCKCGNETIASGIKLRGGFKKSCGCIKSIGEAKIQKILDENNINYLKEYIIKGYKYRYDFYLPNYNILIEYDGKQHFDKPKSGWGKEFESILQRDKEKNKLAFENNFILIRIPYTYLEDIKLQDLLLESQWRVNGN